MKINEETLIEKYGSPDITIDKLKIWIHGWQFPETDEYWDANWLYITIYYCDNNSSVYDSGPYIHLPELIAFTDELLDIDKNLKGKAVLPAIEPVLYVSLEFESLGHINLNITISPEGSSSNHEYEVEIDQSFLKRIGTQIDTILQKYKLRGKP